MELSSPAVEATRVRLLARFGSRVEPWWRGLPAAVAELAQRWDVDVGDAVGRGNTSLVLRCRRSDGRAAMLKLTPDAELARAEASALERWEASGHVPRVWGHDAASGALLLEAIAGETPLADLRAPVALAAVADLISGLHRSGAPVVADGVVPLDERVDFIFEHWREQRGHALARALAAGADGSVLLHGDLHPGNVLCGGAERGLVAIDPRPCVGDPAFDAVDWVFWSVDAPAAWQPRSRELALALGVDPARLWAWCSALAAILATAMAARGGPPEQVAALRALSG